MSPGSSVDPIMVNVLPEPVWQRRGDGVLREEAILQTTALSTISRRPELRLGAACCFLGAIPQQSRTKIAGVPNAGESCTPAHRRRRLR